MNSTKYRIRVRAQDQALNFNSPVSFEFTYNAMPPSSEVTSPAPGSALSALTQLSGTASASTGSVTNVWVSIGKLTPPTTAYFDGNSFGPDTEQFIAAGWAGANPWYYFIPGAPLESGVDGFGKT